MTVEQALYGARIALRASGPVLATLGVADGEAWAAALGALLYGVGEVWGMFAMRRAKEALPPSAAATLEELRAAVDGAKAAAVAHAAEAVDAALARVPKP